MVFIESSITFLGTGRDSFVVGRHIRSAGGFIIKANGSQFHIDPGPGALSSAKQFGVNIRDNTAVLVSNNGLYACNDLNAVIDGMTYSGFDKKGVLISNKTTILGSEKEMPFLLEKYKKYVERFIVLEAGQKAGINEIDVAALKTSSEDENAIGFKFITPQYTLSYSSDTKYAASVAEQYIGSDILVLNVPYLAKRDENDGLSKEDAVKIIAHANPRLAVITGFGAEMIKADPMYEVREIQMKTKIHVIAAKDGMSISTGSYGSMLRKPDRFADSFKGFSVMTEKQKIPEIKKEEQQDIQQGSQAI